MQMVLNSPVGQFAFTVFLCVHLFLTAYGIQHRRHFFIFFDYGRYACACILSSLPARIVYLEPFHIILYIIFPALYLPMVKAYFFPVPAFPFQSLFRSLKKFLFKIQ